MLAAIRTLFLTATLAFANPAWADNIILTLSGAVASSGEDGKITFDIAALQALEPVTFQTTTIWTEGVQEFEGVSLARLLEHVGAQPGTIQATALNDYAVSIPTTDAVAGGPIVAYARNGAMMTVRDKGPLWIVYPFDDNEAYKSEQYYSRSIWQLDRMEIIATN